MNSKLITNNQAYLNMLSSTLKEIIRSEPGILKNALEEASIQSFLDCDVEHSNKLGCGVPICPQCHSDSLTQSEIELDVEIESILKDDQRYLMWFEIEVLGEYGSDRTRNKYHLKKMLSLFSQQAKGFNQVTFHYKRVLNEEDGMIRDILIASNNVLFPKDIFRFNIHSLLRKKFNGSSDKLSISYQGELSSVDEIPRHLQFAHKDFDESHIEMALKRHLVVLDWSDIINPNNQLY